MILKIFLGLLFIIIIALFVFFIAGIFLPTVKNQILKNSDLIFSPVEKNYVFRTVDSNIAATDKRAAVLYPVPEKEKEVRFKYNGIKNCALFSLVYGTQTESPDDCIGFGDCARACPQEAIQIVRGTAVVTKNCSGCGACVEVCPKKLIALFPAAQKTIQYKNSVNNPRIFEIPEKKGFKFWRKWYRILNR